MDNYGWVQNSSNLSTVRDTVDLIPAQGLSHNELMRAIHDQRAARGDLPSRWTWDARCRIKAVCATGMAELDRPRQGYRLTELGTALQSAVRAEEQGRKRRPLSPEEQELFRKGLLTNPPVVRVLSLLQEAAKDEKADQAAVDEANQAIQTMADATMTEAQIENLITAKGYADCVAFLGEDSISVVVSAMENGMTDADAARIGEIVKEQTGLNADQIKIIEAE